MSWAAVVDRSITQSTSSSPTRASPPRSAGSSPRMVDKPNDRTIESNGLTNGHHVQSKDQPTSQSVSTNKLSINPSIHHSKTQSLDQSTMSSPSHINDNLNGQSVDDLPPGLDGIDHRLSVKAARLAEMLAIIRENDQEIQRLNNQSNPRLADQSDDAIENGLIASIKAERMKNLAQHFRALSQTYNIRSVNQSNNHSNSQSVNPSAVSSPRGVGSFLRSINLSNSQTISRSITTYPSSHSRQQSINQPDNQHVAQPNGHSHEAANDQITTKSDNQSPETLELDDEQTVDDIPEEANDQSEEQSIDQSIDQSVDQSDDQSIEQSADHSIDQSVDQSISPVDSPIVQPAQPSINQPVKPSADSEDVFDKITELKTVNQSIHSNGQSSNLSRHRHGRNHSIKRSNLQLVTGTISAPANVTFSNGKWQAINPSNHPSVNQTNGDSPDGRSHVQSIDPTVDALDAIEDWDDEDFSFDQSKNQSANQSINQSNNLSHVQSNNQSINQSPTNHSISQPINSYDFIDIDESALDMSKIYAKLNKQQTVNQSIKQTDDETSCAKPRFENGRWVVDGANEDDPFADIDDLSDDRQFELPVKQPVNRTSNPSIKELVHHMRTASTTDCSIDQDEIVRMIDCLSDDSAFSSRRSSYNQSNNQSRRSSNLQSNNQSNNQSRIQSPLHASATHSRQTSAGQSVNLSPSNQTTGQSISQSNNQLINQSTNRSVNQTSFATIKLMLNPVAAPAIIQSPDQVDTPSTDLSNNQPINQSMDHLSNQPASPSRPATPMYVVDGRGLIDSPTKHALNQSMLDLDQILEIHPINQPVNPSINPSTSPPEASSIKDSLAKYSPVQSINQSVNPPVTQSAVKRFSLTSFMSTPSSKRSSIVQTMNQTTNNQSTPQSNNQSNNQLVNPVDWARLTSGLPVIKLSTDGTPQQRVLSIQSINQTNNHHPNNQSNSPPVYQLVWDSRKLLGAKPFHLVDCMVERGCSTGQFLINHPHHQSTNQSNHQTINQSKVDRCFTVLSVDRTLCIECQSTSDCDLFVRGIIQSIKQTISQPIKQTPNRMSINNQSNNHLIDHSKTHSDAQSNKAFTDDLQAALAMMDEDQPTIPSNNQSTNQSVTLAGFESKRELNEFDLDQLVDQPINQSFKQAGKLSSEQRSLREWLNLQETEYESTNQTIKQSIKQCVKEVTYEELEQYTEQSIDQSSSSSIKQSIYQFDPYIQSIILHGPPQTIDQSINESDDQTDDPSDEDLIELKPGLVATVDDLEDIDWGDDD